MYTSYYVRIIYANLINCNLYIHSYSISVCHCRMHAGLVNYYVHNMHVYAILYIFIAHKNFTVDILLILYNNACVVLDNRGWCATG